MRRATGFSGKGKNNLWRPVLAPSPHISLVRESAP